MRSAVMMEPISAEEVKAQVVAAIYDVESESPLALAHDEDIGSWSARIKDCLVR